MSISACIVARDAAELLAECLASVRDEVDEILLVDNGSHDDTVAVARAAGARIVPSDAVNHEHARNAYIEAATTDWIFVIDADERLVAPAALKNAVNSSSDECLSVERFDWIGEGRWASSPQARIFRRLPHIRYFESLAHASVAPSVRAKGARIPPSGVRLHHLDALLARDHDAKRANFRRRLERQLGEPNAPPILRCFYALELFAIDDDAGSARELAIALAASSSFEPIVSLFRAQQHRARGRFDEAERHAELALDRDSRVFGGRDAVWAVLADAQDRQGRVNDAIATARAAIAERPLVASHHFNLALLLGAPPDAALALNPWIDTPRVLVPGARPSIFVQQDVVLGRYRAR